jgi:hypothetical protein
MKYRCSTQDCCWRLLQMTRGVHVSRQQELDTGAEKSDGELGEH